MLQPNHQSDTPQFEPPPREPILNVPGFVAAMAVAMIAIHLLREYAIDGETDIRLLISLAYFPARPAPFDTIGLLGEMTWWTPFTYSLLHGGWMHLVFNLFWLAAFGSPVALRLGWFRTLMLALLTSAAGAFAHYLSHIGQPVPVVGASAVVSGFMGAAARFAFNRRGGQGFDPHGRSLTLAESFSDVRFLGFVGVWLVLNLLFGAGVNVVPGETAQIAWQAHVGGFFAGLFAFSLFDRQRQN